MSLNFSKPQRIQRGMGIGGIFSALSRIFIPIRKIMSSPITKKLITSPMAKSIAKQTAKSAVKIIGSDNKKRKLNSELENIRKKALKVGKQSLNQMLEQKLGDTESESEEEEYNKKTQYKKKKKKKKQLKGNVAKKIKDLLD